MGLIGVHFRGQFVELVPWNGSVSWDVAPWGRSVYNCFVSGPSSLVEWSNNMCALLNPIAIGANNPCGQFDVVPPPWQVDGVGQVG